VADAPSEALLARADELARRWAIALILALPVERIGEFPLEGFAREAPALCAAVVRALQSDDELARIAPREGAGGEGSFAGRVAEVTGAPDGRAAVEAVEALRGVLWQALLEELRWRGFEQAPAHQVADLADRLAYVCATALSTLPWSAPAAGAAVGSSGPGGAAATELAHADREPVVGRSGRAPLGGGVVIVDEGQLVARRTAHAHERARAVDGVAPNSAAQPAGAASQSARRARARPRPWDTPLRGSSAGTLDEPA
jgi:hypothetical protein